MDEVRKKNQKTILDATFLGRNGIDINWNYFYFVVRPRYMY